VGAGSRDDLLAVLGALASVQGEDRTTEFNARWIQPQLRAGLPMVLDTARGADYVVSNVKIVLAGDDGVVIPGATVTYDPPGSFAAFEKSRAADRQGRIMDLVALPRALVDPDGRWPAWARFTGFWTGEERGVPASALAAFVDAGPPPVVVTLGSMLMVDRAHLSRVLAEALARTGHRAVVVGGWADLADWPADARVHRVAEAPYDWLFTRAACVIHHGGTGTVAAVLRAGVPSIVLPQLTAQERFARMLLDARLATGAFDADSVTADALADALGRAVGDENVRASARRWQREVGADPGVSGAAALIEAHAAELNAA
jgi:UDP:flavonoid glycosyltransferase YjiC (YdhE family)